MYAQTSGRAIKGELLWSNRHFSSPAQNATITSAVLDCGNFDLTPITYDPLLVPCLSGSHTKYATGSVFRTRRGTTDSVLMCEPDRQGWFLDGMEGQRRSQRYLLSNFKNIYMNQQLKKSSFFGTESGRGRLDR